MAWLTSPSTGTLMSEPRTSSLLQLRLLVGYLGERTRYGWWPTGFYGASSTPFVQPVFETTIQLVQYHGVLEAARLVHDEHLSVGVYHLFRLPEELEQDLHRLARDPITKQFAAEVLASKDDALQRLRDFAKAAVVEGVGPIRICDIRDIHLESSIEAVASVYVHAFAQNVKSYPYMVR
jgi:hypothetical protein